MKYLTQQLLIEWSSLHFLPLFSKKICREISGENKIDCGYVIQPNSPPHLHAGHICGDDQLGHIELGLDKSETARMRGRLSLLLTLETSWGAHTRTPGEKQAKLPTHA